MKNVDEISSLVSIVMPVYNGEKYLKEAIQSILTQSYRNFEFIIINDGSKDNTEEIIKSFCDSRIVYIKNPVNYKLIKTLNIGFSLSKGKYIARMDADDVSHPTRIEKQVRFLETHLEYGLVGSGVNVLTRNEKKELLYHTDDSSIKFALAFYCPFIHPSIMLRKSVIADMDAVFDINYLHAEDYALWTRLASRTKFANIPEYLLDYRIHTNQISSQHAIHQTELAKEIRINYLEKLLGQPIHEFDFIFKLTNRDVLFTEKYRQIKKLYNIDKRKSVFGGDNLTRYLHQTWKNLFLEVKSLGFKDYCVFLSCSITWETSFKFQQFFAIFLKSFK